MLRRQLKATPETVDEFDLAAEERYWDGCQLVTGGHELAGIYLLGYVAELILKHACFRTDRARPGDPAASSAGRSRTRWTGSLSVASGTYTSTGRWSYGTAPGGCLRRWCGRCMMMSPGCATRASACGVEPCLSRSSCAPPPPPRPSRCATG